MITTKEQAVTINSIKEIIFSLMVVAVAAVAAVVVAVIIIIITIIIMLDFQFQC